MKLSEEQKKLLLRILVSGALAAAGAVIAGTAGMLLILGAYLLCGADIVWSALKRIPSLDFLDEEFLMSAASAGAFLTGEYPEAAAVMIFYRIGELFEDYAVDRSRRSVAELMDIKPDSADVERDGVTVRVHPSEVMPGEIITVSPGGRIPLDGTVTEGSGSIDTSSLTGESVPREVSPGDEVVSGCISLSGVLKIRVCRPFGESTVMKILDLMENASSRKAKTEKFITRFARWYTPVVVGCAVLLSAAVPLILKQSFGLWIRRALIFLVVSCPCALVVSVPLSFFGGIGGASKRGILIKSSSSFEKLAKTGTVVFDKTGTVTKGAFAVTSVVPAALSADELIEITALAESYSNHPIAVSVRDAYGKTPDKKRISAMEEIAGRGVKAIIDNRSVCAGNSAMMEENGICLQPGQNAGTTVHVSVDGVYAGHIVISDEIKPNARGAVERLRSLGIRVAMLTGDNESAAALIASQAGIEDFRSGLLPAGKVEEMERLLGEKKPGTFLAFAGDGINDAPVLACADIGIAMGAMGSDAAIEAADVVLMNDDISLIPTAAAIAKKTVGIAYQNIVFSLLVKVSLLILAAFGLADMWMAVFADVGVLVIAIINSMRSLSTSGIK